MSDDSSVINRFTNRFRGRSAGSSSNRFALITSSELAARSIPMPASEEPDRVDILPSVFLAASENGFVSAGSGPDAGAWRCMVPGGLLEIEWPCLPLQIRYSLAADLTRKCRTGYAEDGRLLA